MSLKLVEVVVLGQVLRLNVPAEQEEILRQAARNLDLQVSEMKSVQVYCNRPCAFYCCLEFKF